jgi:hypothetical protein
MVRRQFAEKANQVGPWIERQMDAVTAIGMGLQVSYPPIVFQQHTGDFYEWETIANRLD